MGEQMVAGSLMMAAADLTHRLLDDNPARLQHSAGVAARAQLLAETLPAEQREVLIAAAWLHDIGYAEPVRSSGFHPLDGARYLREHGWPETVCALVAHHSGARFVAHVRGLDTELAEFDYVEDPVSDALTVADQTTGPDGQPVSVDQRLREMLDRHGPDSPNARAHPVREPYLHAAAARVQTRRDGPSRRAAPGDGQ